MSGKDAYMLLNQKVDVKTMYLIDEMISVYLIEKLLDVQLRIACIQNYYRTYIGP